MGNIKIQRDPITRSYNIWTPDPTYGSLCVGEIFKQGDVWCWRIDLSDANGWEYKLADAKEAAIKAAGEEV